uniref:Uncharacterized protein n=1 Tax=Arundo donax TaxID=35708 RepID=A0A0A9GR70_ARUDO
MVPLTPRLALEVCICFVYYDMYRSNCNNRNLISSVKYGSICCRACAG